MLFQASVKLNIENRDVHVNFDFDTGLIGFTEKIKGELKEYYFSGAPLEFKKAFLERFENVFAEDRHLNFKICRKNPDVIQATGILFENK